MSFRFLRLVLELVWMPFLCEFTVTLLDLILGRAVFQIKHLEEGKMGENRFFDAMKLLIPR